MASLCGFGNAVLLKWIWKCFFLFFFFENFQKYLVLILLWYLLEFTSEVIWSCAFVSWKVFVAGWLSLLVIGLLTFSVSQWFTLERIFIFRNLSIYSRCPIWWLIIFLGSLMILCSYELSVIMSPLSFLFESSLVSFLFSKIQL